MKDNNNLLKAQVILSAVIVLMMSILIAVIVVGASEVKPLVNEVSAKMDSLEIPDFSRANELMDKFEPLLELANEFNDPILRYYLKEFKNFMQRLDGIEGADLVINGLPGWSQYYSNESWRRE